jgi:multiple sugar transport system permease protein
MFNRRNKVGTMQRKKINLWVVLVYVFLVAETLMVIFPVALMVSSSFKNEMEILSYPIKFIPEKPILNNYLQLWENFPRYIMNSFKVTIIIVIAQFITSATGGYAFAKLRWKGRDTIFLLYIVALMIPIQVYIIPQFMLIRRIGLYDSHMGLVLVSTFSAVGTFLFRQFFLTIPDSLIESAKLDGATHFQIFTRIILPLSKPVIATQVVLAFRWFWNDFFAPMIYLTSDRLKTLPLGLGDFALQYYTYYGPQMAASVLSVIPVMILFFVAQRYIVQGFAASGIKG